MVMQIIRDAEALQQLAQAAGEAGDGCVGHGDKAALFGDALSLQHGTAAVAGALQVGKGHPRLLPQVVAQEGSTSDGGRVHVGCDDDLRGTVKGGAGGTKTGTKTATV